MTSLNDIWTHLVAGTKLGIRRPDFRFDPEFYARIYPELAGEPEAMSRHFGDFGAAEGRHGTYYSQLRAQAPHIDAALGPLVTHPKLQAAIEADEPGALELAFELIQLGSPVDALISNFSMQAYLEWHPDIEAAGMNPLMHYLRFGSVEGGRRTLADLRKGLYEGAQVFYSKLPTVLICVHEMSDTDAPVVGHALVREASQSHNVVVATHRGGELLDQFLPHCCGLLVTSNPLREMPYIFAEPFQKIDFALLNSVECMLFIHPLVGRGIPFAAYIHEYSDYTHPVWVKMMAVFADLLIFSSEHVRDNWRGRLADVNFNIENDSIIIPQHQLVEGEVTEERRVAARALLSRVLGCDLSKVRLICGVGHVQWRKGTDIFLQAAQISAESDSDTVFIWIGDGQNHQEMGFGVWFDYHLRQARVNRPDGNLFLLPAGPLYPDVMDAADAMFLSSRLDPLPNVVFDAVRRGGRIVCFDGATGFADDRYRGSARIVCVPYANPMAAVQALRELPRKVGIAFATESAFGEGITLFDRLRRAFRELPRKAGFAAAVDSASSTGMTLFDSLRLALRDRLAAERNLVLGETAIDIPFLFTKSEADRPLRRKEQEKMFGYGRRLLWRDVQDARDTVAASQNWVHRRTRIEDFRPLATDDASVPDFAIHVHAFYVDDLADALADHAAFARASRILVTTDSPDKADRIRQMGEDRGLHIETQLVPNQGRDILPFLRLFGDGGLAGGSDIWCHLHQKKSVQTTSHGDVWRRFLYRILLGDERSLSSALACIALPEVGVVAPFEPHFVPWDDSRRLLPGIADRFAEPLPDNPLLFPMGNMFWTKADVARRMLNLFGPDHPWPNEPIPTDGTEFHLIERLWPAVAAQAELDAIFLHKADEERV